MLLEIALLKKAQIIFINSTLIVKVKGIMSYSNNSKKEKENS